MVLKKEYKYTQQSMSSLFRLQYIRYCVRFSKADHAPKNYHIQIKYLKTITVQTELALLLQKNNHSCTRYVLVEIHSGYKITQNEMNRHCIIFQCINPSPISTEILYL